jgi:molybdopterin synthase catalytic subunit
MYLTSSPIDVAKMLLEARASDGALCLFLGVVRNENEGKPTASIEYEAYAPMAESEMSRVAQALRLEFPQTRVTMIHREGKLSIGEVSVAIVAVSPHRAEAFAACRAAIDRIKTTVPIWKREFHPDGTSDWVDPTKESGHVRIG